MAAVSVPTTITADRLRPAMAKAGLTQRAVAKRLRVPHTDVCKALAFAAPGGLLSRIAEAIFDADTVSVAAPNE